MVYTPCVLPAVPGVTAAVSNDTLTCAYNDLAAVQQLVLQHRGEVAAIIVEPVAGNMGCVLPQPGFLEGLRQLCDAEGIVFIFDEVMTGFRLAPGGAQERLGVQADLMTFGKVIGAGLPVGAFGGKREIMECIAPLGQVYQAGTLSGNPVAMIAGLTLLRELQARPAVYEELEAKTVYLRQGLSAALTAGGHTFTINQLGSMISVHFGAHPVVDFATAAASNIDRFKAFFHHMLQQGIYLPPSAYESWFLNNALSYNDLDETIAAAASFTS